MLSGACSSFCFGELLRSKMLGGLLRSMMRQPLLTKEAVHTVQLVLVRFGNLLVLVRRLRRRLGILGF